MVRAFVRQWMALPNDISIGYFYAPVSEGGLGIPSLRWLAPLHHKYRLLGLVSRRRMENITDSYLAKAIGHCRQRLTENGSTYTTHEEIKKRSAAILHQSIDGSSSKTRIMSPANTNEWRMGPHLSQAETTLTATK